MAISVVMSSHDTNKKHHCITSENYIELPTSIAKGTDKIPKANERVKCSKFVVPKV